MDFAVRIQLTRHYRQVLFIWGIVAAIFGICALIWPSLTISTLLYLFGIFAVANGILGIIAAVLFERRFFLFWSLQLGAGIFSILLGAAVLVWPTLTILLAIWAIITGILQVSLAWGNRGAQPVWLPAIIGAVLIFLGLILLAANANPLGALLAIVWVIGIYALVYGASLLWRAWYLHSLQYEATHPRDF